MRRIALLVIPVIVVGSLSGCVFAAGPLTSEDRSIDAATTVVLDTSGELTISEGAPGLVIHAAESVLDRLTSEVRDGVLTLGSRPGAVPFLLGEVRYELTLPSLDRLEVNGSGDIESDLPVGDLAIEINGSGDVDFSVIDGSAVAVEINGSGDVELEGRTDEFTVSSAGSADISADKLDAARVTIDLDGSGDVEVAASQTLDVSIAGSASVTYSGNPQITQEISGSGEVSRG